jgi:pimeloyl-ACP methyl ester carboxylesterase
MDSDAIRLELLTDGPPNPAEPPLLFLHGAFGGAWMWAEHTLRWFAGHGRQTYALSFRGHGGSDGYAALQGTGLGDYLADTLAVMRVISRPVVVIGHSLGALIGQRLLASPEARGHVLALGLLTPVPLEGMASSSAWLALSDPPLFQALALAGSGLHRPNADEARQALFSADMPECLVRSYNDRLQPESALALTEAQFPSMVPSATWFGVPSLVLVADADRLIAPDAAQRTAFWHGARCISVPGPHLFMLDATWQRAAEAVRDWLAEVGR